MMISFQAAKEDFFSRVSDSLYIFYSPFYETRFPHVLVARNDRDCVVISNFVAPFSWYGRQRMNYIYFIRDQIENIKKPQLFFIVVNEGGRFDFVAEFDPYCSTEKTGAGYWQQ
jgi:hypothetical protein